MTAPPAVEAVGLAKKFKEVEALAGLDLVAPSGKVTAVLGPNGAGKSTFVGPSPRCSSPTRAACWSKGSMRTHTPIRCAG